jgi:pyridoxine 4-dehydrogenase
VTGNRREPGGSFMLGSWRVRRAGYGAMQLAGDGVFGPPRDRGEALRVLAAAAAARVNHIDTAQFYGAGTVNELIREALYPYPDGLAILSKVGARRDAGDAVLRSGEARELRQGIEDNLRALGTGRLAAVNLRLMDPSQTPGRRFDAQLAVLVQAREEGLIGGIGLSNVSRAQLLRAAAQTEIVCVQNLFNLADQRSLDVLTECQARNIAFVPFCPLGWPGEVRHRLLADPILAAQGARLGATPGQVALAWLLDLAPNVLLIPGTRTRAHLAENLASAGVELDDATRAELARHFPAAREPGPGGAALCGVTRWPASRRGRRPRNSSAPSRPTPATTALARATCPARWRRPRGLCGG